MSSLDQKIEAIRGVARRQRGEAIERSAIIRPLKERTPDDRGGTYAAMSRLVLKHLGGETTEFDEPMTLTPLGYLLLMQTVRGDIVAGIDRAGIEDVPLEPDILREDVPLDAKCDWMVKVVESTVDGDFAAEVRELAIAAELIRPPAEPMAA